MGNLKLKSCLYCFVVFIVLASCKNNKIDDLEAKKLINDALKLPRISIIYIDYGSKYNIDEYEKYGTIIDDKTNLPSLHSSKYIDYPYLYNNNILYTNNIRHHWGFLYGFINIKEEYKKYLVGNYTYTNCENYTNTYRKLKVYDLEIGDITGIAYNEDKTVATIRFTIKSTNHTPFAKAIKEFDYNTPANAEIIFRKFDTGWQLDDKDIKKYNLYYLKEMWIYSKYSITNAHCIFGIE